MSLTYTTGNPTNLTGGATASMTDISGPFADIKTFLTDGAASIGTTLLANNAVTAAKIESQQAWQTISISGTNITTTNVGYFKDSLGIVHFRGDNVPVTNTVSDGTQIGTLPAGYRPGTTSPQYFPYARTSGTASGFITITSAGAIFLQGMNPGGASGFTLAGIHLRAEN